MAFSSKSVSFELKVSSLLIHLVIIFFFALILGAKSITTGSKADLMQIISTEKESCYFEESHKLYNVSDFLRCLNSMASSLLFQNTLRLTEERAASGIARGSPYSQVTSGYAGQQDNELIKPGSSDNKGLTFPPERQFGYYVPESGHDYYPSQTGPGSSENPNSGFFNALSSISQYDDFQCVPRILCEATSGVVPGTSSYKQASLFESFGQNALLGLLSAFDASTSSPLITFAKAAILGYSSRGNPYSCYREYPKCPRNYDSLIHYLNNHKGGFFRFLSGLTGGYRSFSQIPSEQTETENLYLGKLSKIPSVLDVDDTNSRELEEEPSSRQEEHSLKPSLSFPSDDNKSGLEKVLLPIIGQINNQQYRAFKSLNFYPTSSTSNSATHKRTSFFPQDKKK